MRRVGGAARAKKLTPERRREIARKAARARWAKGEVMKRGQTKPKKVTSLTRRRREIARLVRFIDTQCGGKLGPFRAYQPVRPAPSSPEGG